MSDDLTTYSGVEAVLAATSDYDVTNDAAKAIRHVAALRRKLHFASSSGRDGVTIQFQQQFLADQLKQVIAWLEANGTLSDAQRTRNPAVTHADFSGFGQYGGRGFHSGDRVYP